MTPLIYTRALYVCLLKFFSNKRFFYSRLLVCVMVIGAGLWLGSRAAEGRKESASERRALKIQRGVVKVVQASQFLPPVQTGIPQNVGNEFRPYTPPPKPDRERRPVAPGSDMVIFSAPQNLSRAQSLRLAPFPAVSTFTIVIVPGPTLAANAPALAAFQAAAQSWATRFTDPITVVVNADMAALGPGIIGSTSSVLLTASYSTIRNAVVNDANASADVNDNIAASLPTAAQFLATLPAGFGLDGNIFASKANLKALGFTGLDAITGSPSDGEIIFSSNFTFDYDRSDGITAGTMDFQTVAAHEIGHLLGFFSAVDDVDFILPGTASNIEPTPLDLYRFRSGFEPTTTALFTNSPRNFVPQHEGVTSDTVTAPRMSTGLDFGDGRQASHWKDNSLTGLQIGIMDPTLSFATVMDQTDADFHALDLIGYDFQSGSAPVASATPNPAVTDEDTPIQITLSGDDADDNDLTFTITDTPDHGSLGSISSPDCSATNICTATVTYTPSADYNGGDSFKFKANDGAFDSSEITVNITINQVPDITISNVTQVEGNSGTTAFTFNVDKAGAGAASVQFATQDDTAIAGSDYASNSGTLNFASGDTTKSVIVLVNGDMTPETNETFFVKLSNASGAAIASDTGTGTIGNDDESVNVGQLIISEFRLRGPGGMPLMPATLQRKSPMTTIVQRGPASASADSSPAANDEFIELYNSTDAPLLVTTTDNSSGWAVAASDGVVRFVIPNGTIIPARGHFLGVNTLGYSLSNYPAGNGGTATGDATYTLDIPDNVGIALFRSSTPANFSPTTRLDAVGSTTEANALYKEGAGYAALAPLEINANLQHSFYRSLCSFVAGATCSTPGVPKDTGNNSVDFIFVDTNGTLTSAGQNLGAPGPEGLTSPIRRDAGISLELLDVTKQASATPNRERVLTPDPGNNSTFGTLTVRRRVVNNTGQPVTRLRFRIVEFTTYPAPLPSIADLRARSSEDENILVADQTTCTASGGGSAPCTVTVRGTILEQPPTQILGGGLNSTMSLNLGAPLPAGQSVNVNFLLGVQQPGLFRFLVIIEALP